MAKRFFGFKLLALCALAALTGTAFAKGGSVTVHDQVANAPYVMIDTVSMDMPGFIVIHASSADGKIGPVIGWREINVGSSTNIAVEIDDAKATATLYAMLHYDTGEVGKYEFGTVDGADLPVEGDQMMVTPAFKIDLVHADDQFIKDNIFTVSHVVAQKDGFIVIHSGDRSGPGPVLGFAPVKAGFNMDIAVTLSGDVTPIVWPMLHVDDGTMGEYNFGKVEGEDGPVVDAMGHVAMAAVVVGEPSMRAESQLVTDTIMISSVLSQGPGFVVIHADNAGAPGEVLGFAPVMDGFNENVAVTVDAAKVTAIVYPMLHADTGKVGTYEFGEVAGEDLPQMAGGKPLFFPILAKPGIIYTGGMSGDDLTVQSALIDTQGWLVIHADNAGAPGAVLGFTPLVKGLNQNVKVTLAADGRTATVYPMLHTDTGVMGKYEFGETEGADLPVKVGDNAVFGPLMPTDMGTMK